MRFAFSNNSIDRLHCWFYNHIVEPFARYRDKHKKTYYWCTVCGLTIAPYFDDTDNFSVKHDRGWHKIQGTDRWICHHCMDHGFASEIEKDVPLESCTREYTWDEWQELVVEPSKARIEKLIEEKDPEYYKREIDL